MLKLWISTVRIAYPAFHLWYGHVDHTVWETTRVIGDLGAGEKKRMGELSAEYRKRVGLMSVKRKRLN